MKLTAGVPVCHAETLMNTVSIPELHAKTGELVRQATVPGEILVTDNGRRIAKIVPRAETEQISYFARRRPSAAFLRLDRREITGGGTDATRTISEDRDGGL